jgi:hypothetical protein
MLIPRLPLPEPDVTPRLRLETVVRPTPHKGMQAVQIVIDPDAPSGTFALPEVVPMRPRR